MSLKTVRDAIATALTASPRSTPRVTLTEARSILAAAEGDGEVSGVEREELQKFYQRRQGSAFDGEAERLLEAFLGAPVQAPGTASPNRARMNVALEALGKLVIASNGAITSAMVSTLVAGISTPRGREPESAEGVLGVAHALRAAKTMTSMSASARTAFNALVAKAGRPATALEKQLLYKALAARETALTTGPSSAAAPALEELEQFAATIRNQPRAVLLRKTRVTDPDADSTAEGLMQRFDMSCVPSSLQIVRGEADPVYAWHLNESKIATFAEPSDAVAKEQRDWLERAGGVAVARPTIGGEGMWPERIIDDVLSKTIGSTFTRLDTSDAAARRDAIAHLAALLEEGYDVPLIAGPSTNHCMVFSDVRTNPKGREFLMQDPWTGKATWMKESELVDGGTFGTMQDASMWVLYEPAEG